VLLGIFVIYPIIAVIYYSFTDYDIVRPPVWIGLENFQNLFADYTFWLALTHSFVLPAGHADPHRAVDRAGDRRQSPAARASTSIGRSTSCPRSVAASPSACRGAGCSSGPGSSTACCLSLGWISEPVQWLADPALVLPIAMLLTIWAGFGYYAVIFLAGLQNIPEELYDAAAIDGCNDFQKHRTSASRAAAPDRVRGVISSLAALKVFDEIYVLTNRTGGILDSGVTIVFYLWKQAFELQPRGLRLGDRDRAAGDHARLLDRQRAHPRARAGRGMSGRRRAGSSVRPIVAQARRGRRRRPSARTACWYALLTAIAVITVFPFVWML
jgi:putative chitobiose transport system permease protein